MMKKSIFAALTLAAASPALAQSEQTTQNGDITEKWNTPMTNIKWKPTTSGTTGSSRWAQDRR